MNVALALLLAVIAVGFLGTWYIEARRPDSNRRLLDDLAREPLVIEVLVAARVGLHVRAVVRGIDGAPDWFGYEDHLWELSEEFRAYLRRRRTVRGPGPVFDAVAQIVTDRGFGKGRENFVIVLGQFGGPAYADTIGGLLDDPDVSAHALYALRRLKDGRFVEQARALLANPPFPVHRKEARSYLRAFQVDEGSPH